MSKISQREILGENFWKQFSSVARRVGETGKAIGNVVAPEIADPIKRGHEWLKPKKMSRELG
jgi:hypothetical protein